MILFKVYSLFKVFKSSNDSYANGVGFRLQCPGDSGNKPSKHIMFNNGTIYRDILYTNICSTSFKVTVEYNDDRRRILIDQKTDTLIEHNIRTANFRSGNLQK